MTFDFDQWQRLARDNPAAFEQQRREAIEALIATAPPARRARLRGLQCRIDLERRRAGTALAGALRMQQMLAGQLQQLADALARLGACGQRPRLLPHRAPAPVVRLERER